MGAESHYFRKSAFSAACWPSFYRYLKDGKLRRLSETFICTKKQEELEINFFRISSGVFLTLHIIISDSIISLAVFLQLKRDTDLTFSFAKRGYFLARLL